MYSEEFFSSICGPPLAANTAVSRDVGICHHTLTPSYSVKASYKKSSTPPHCLAVNESHIYAAQEGKAQVHVYSRQRGNQETFVSLPERIRCLAIHGDTLFLGTTEGRLIVWETCSGRQLTTPPCHVQAVTCIATTSSHILSASEDSNINVWSLASLVELDAPTDFEPELVLSNHRGAVTSLDVSPSNNLDSAICVSASKDKTCIIWNYRTGEVLRTLLMQSPPLCVRFDPSVRALAVATEDSTVSVVELFGKEPLLGPKSAESASIAIQVNAPLGSSPSEAGIVNCLAFSYDGTTMLTGHAKGKIVKWSLKGDGQPSEIANLNASVTNVVLVPLIQAERMHRAVHVVKPNQVAGKYAFTSRLSDTMSTETRFSKLLNEPGFSAETIEKSLAAFLDADGGSPNAEIDMTGELLRDVMDQNRASMKAGWEPRDSRRCTRLCMIPKIAKS